MTPQEKLRALLKSKAAANIVEIPQPAAGPDGIIYNEAQQKAIDLALAGYSFCLTGPAGTGKTTVLRAIIQALLQSPRNKIMNGLNHKHLPMTGAPGIISCAYTNKATSNIRRNLPTELHKNSLTFHKLLEFEPNYFTIDGNDGPKTTMRFEPARHRANPLPPEIYVALLEESSMTDVPLWNQFIDALPHPIQIIFVGDIQQLPPVFGKSIFIHAMQAKLPTVELTEVYRQALESPILSLAHRVLSGKPVPAPELSEWNIDKTSTGHGKLTIQPWKKSLSDTTILRVMGSWLPEMIDSGKYLPEEDIILMPQNVNFGTIEVNKIVASHIAKNMGAEVYEVFTGLSKAYFRIGDRVLYNKSEARITKIEENKSYYGKMPRMASTTLDYFGVEHDAAKADINRELTDEETEAALARIDRMFSAAVEDHTSEDSPTARAASHKITVVSVDTGMEYIISSAGDVNNLLLGYAITVHKSQGSEYRRVFFLTHKSHNHMLYRELLYTAITRAKEELYIVCEPNMLVQGINTQRLPGKNVEEKIAQFDKVIKQARGSSNEDQTPVGLDRLLRQNGELHERAAA